MQTFPRAMNMAMAVTVSIITLQLNLDAFASAKKIHQPHHIPKKEQGKINSKIFLVQGPPHKHSRHIFCTFTKAKFINILVGLLHKRFCINY
jgi:hypothetical protein